MLLFMLFVVLSRIRFYFFFQIKKLKKERNSILRKIHTIIKKKEEEKLLSQIKDIEQSKNDSRHMFKAIQFINKTLEGNYL